MFCFFFFSSRRRHTRCSRDWSSDVCSSDLDHAHHGGCWSRGRRLRGIGHGPYPTGPPPRLALRCARSEEHTSELQSRLHLVCRLLLEKKKLLKTMALLCPHMLLTASSMH